MPLAIFGIANPPPYAPLLLQPANASYQDLATAPTFSWTYQPANPNNTQTAWAFRRKIASATSYQWFNVSTNAWQSTEYFNIAPNQSQITFSSNQWNNGNVYNWSVATQDQSGIGPYSNDFTVTSQTGPVVSSVTPSGIVNTGQPTITWSAFYPINAYPASYRVIVYTSLQVVTSGFVIGSAPYILDTGIVPSSGISSYAITTAYLQDGVQYRVYVQVTETGGQSSNWTYSTFTTSFAQPLSPTIQATPVIDPVTGAPMTVVSVSIPPLNLLSVDDASFEGGPGSWGSGANAIPSQSSAEALSGSYSMGMTASIGNQQRLFESPVNVVSPNAVYTVMASFRASPNATAHDMIIFIEHFDMNLAYLGSLGSFYVTDSSNNWAQASGQIITGPSTKYVRFQVGLANNDETYTAGISHYIDEVALYQGTPSANLIPDTSDLHTWNLVGGWLVQPSPLGGNQIVGTNANFYGLSQIFSVVGGQTYNLSAYLDASLAPAGGGCKIGIYATDISASYGLLNAVSGQKGYQEGSLTIPSGVSEVVALVENNGVAATPTQYWTIAQPQLTLGSTSQPYIPGSNWSSGNQLSSDTLIIGYTEGTNPTIYPVRNGINIPIPSTNNVVINDYEISAATPRTYVATVINSANRSSSPFSNSSQVSVLAITEKWWLKDPLNPSANMSLSPAPGDLSYTDTFPQKVVYPTERIDPIVLYDVVKLPTISMSLIFRTITSYNAFAALRESAHVLLLQGPGSIGQWYVMIGATKSDTVSLASIRGRSSSGNPIWTTDVTFIAVASPA